MEQVGSCFLHGMCHTSGQSHPGAPAMPAVYTCAGRCSGGGDRKRHRGRHKMSQLYH